MNLIRAFAVGLALAGLPLCAPADTAMPMGEAVHLGPLVLSGGFSRATLPNAPVAGGFLTIQNTGTADDRLIGVSSEVAGHVEVHEMAMVGDVMKMRQLKDGLPIPAGQTVTLKPGGIHVMFMGLKQPLVQGKTVIVTLTFEKAGSVQIPLAIGAPNATAPDAMPGMDMGAAGTTSGALVPAPGLPGGLRVVEAG